MLGLCGKKAMAFRFRNRKPEADLCHVACHPIEGLLQHSVQASGATSRRYSLQVLFREQSPNAINLGSCSTGF